MTDTTDAIVKSIPKEGWKKLIDTACDTITDILAPITKTTAGLGGLVEAKFDAMVDVQKVFAADALARAKKKIERTRRPINPHAKSRVIVTSIENASNETEEDLREVWANLIANEMLFRSVRPDFPRILSRLSGADALELTEVAKDNEDQNVQAIALKVALNVTRSMKGMGVIMDALSPATKSFSLEHLHRLDLIHGAPGAYKLTILGEKFLTAVSEPQPDDPS